MRRLDWFVLTLILLSFIPIIVFYKQLPDQIPMHWNLSGEVDRYMAKPYGAFMMPILNLFMFVLFFVTPKIDPRKENYASFQNAYSIFRSAINLIFVVLSQLILIYTLNDPKDLPEFMQMSFIVPLLISILFIIMGNYFGKIKHNYFIGIRTPWTLNNEEVWYKTHRLAGKLFVISGLIGLIGSFFSSVVTFVMLIGPITITVIIVYSYSYFVFKKLK